MSHIEAIMTDLFGTQTSKHLSAIEVRSALRAALSQQGEPEQPNQSPSPEYDRGFSDGGDRGHAHSAQPAQQPLSDEQMAKCWAGGDHNASASVKRRITRAIEAAHGITQKGTT